MKISRKKLEKLINEELETVLKEELTSIKEQLQAMSPGIPGDGMDSGPGQYDDDTVDVTRGEFNLLIGAVQKLFNAVEGFHLEDM